MAAIHRQGEVEVVRSGQLLAVGGDGVHSDAPDRRLAGWLAS